MDFPKSVPGVGLVDGKFVDENTSTGQAGSLIPAKWANDLTLELLNLIRRAGLTPDEERTDQIGQAVAELIASQIDAKLVRELNAGRQLTALDMGLLLLDASAQPDVYTLPKSDGELGIRDVILRRTDNGGNRLVVQATGSDRIKFHTHLRAEGYPFLVLMGAGDYWWLRSDGAGNWWPIARLDNDALGRPVFETTTLFSPGGWGALAGSVFNRSEWPWLWDHAQQSGMLTAEAERAGLEGGWTSGDGVANFRGPEARGEFLRILDDGRGVNAGRLAGSWEDSDNKEHDHPATAGRAGAHNHTIPDSNSASGTGNRVDGSSEGQSRTIPTSTAGEHDHPITVAASGGSESRPRSIAYPGRIKLI